MFKYSMKAYQYIVAVLIVMFVLIHVFM